MTIFGPGNNHDTFTISAGEMAFVPMGSLHHIENLTDEPVKMLICFDNSSPEDTGDFIGSQFHARSCLGGNLPSGTRFFSILKNSEQRPSSSER